VGVATVGSAEVLLRSPPKALRHLAPPSPPSPVILDEAHGLVHIDALEGDVARLGAAAAARLEVDGRRATLARLS